MQTKPHRNKAEPPLIVVHLDFKGVQFKPSYWPQLMADLASQKINTILVEYEDIFPFEDGIELAGDKATCWSLGMLQEFQQLASDNRIEIIPLQQTLGHLEYLFQWERYRHLALDQEYPGVVDITSVAARELIGKMLRQVIIRHPASRFVHVGMDEAHTLTKYAMRSGQDPLQLFMQHLAEICAICEEYGKRPIMWSDMWEDHLTPALLRQLQSFKDRIILAPWDYTTTSSAPLAVGRIAGWRTSRAWLQEPGIPAAPTLMPHYKWIEELPRSIRQLLGPALQGRHFTPLFQADLWSNLGFRLLGASALRSSSHRAVMPDYNALGGNIETWSTALQRNAQMGQIGTAWARGTSWCPPTFPFDLCWPLITTLARSMGARPRPFFPGIPAATLRRLVATLGRCRSGWRIETAVADEMESLVPQLREHHYEWCSMILMVRLLHLQRQAEFAVSEVDFFHANSRPVPAEWQRRQHAQEAIRVDFKKMQRTLQRHFGQRYHGAAFNEWLEDTCGTPIRRFDALTRECQRKYREAEKLYRQR